MSKFQLTLGTEDRMNRRKTLMLVGVLLTIAISPQAAFSQSDPMIGTWQLNLAKSKFSPGPPPKSITHTLQQDGENRKFRSTGVNAEGNPLVLETMHIYDGMPHPSTGSPTLLALFDASAYTRVDANTIILSRLKAGKLVQVETVVVSPDGKTWTATRMGIDANGRRINDIAVYDKQ
jgi:hypothetical protein